MPQEKKVAQELRSQLSRAMVEHAFFRLESAFNIALTIILIFLFPQPFPWWKWWYWLLVGTLAEWMIVFTSLKDPETSQKVLRGLFRERFNPKALRNKKHRDRVEKALEYQERIEAVIRGTRPGVLRDHLQDTADAVAEWIANIFRIARRLDAYERDQLLKRDIYAVPQALRELEDRFRQEDDEGVRRQMEETLLSRRAQWESLQKLQNTMEKAEFLLEKTLSDLGHIYSQLQQIEARDVESGRTQRIAQDISAEIAELQDIADTMEEVYSLER